MRPDALLWDVIRAPSVARQGEVVAQPAHEIWVRSTDGVIELAEKVWAQLQERLFVDIACMGANPTNIGVKTVAEMRKMASSWSENPNIDVICQPFFSSFMDDQKEERTRVVLRVFLQAREPRG